jgi:hypothetical protein
VNATWFYRNLFGSPVPIPGKYSTLEECSALANVEYWAYVIDKGLNVVGVIGPNNQCALDWPE